MKFLVFSDQHEDSAALAELLKRAKQKDVDFIICAGDFTEFGRGMRNVFKKFNALKKNFYVIPGNHEEGASFTDAVKDYEYIINFDRKVFKKGEYVFLGYGRDGFSVRDPEFRKVARDWYGKYNGQKIVLVTHGPPAGTKLDKLGDRHIGNVDYRKFIERIKPKLAISGHLHETAGAVDKVGKTKLISPCWEGMVIELK